eukprot:ANDGO_02905.mRNA.1 hypothetical protein
MRRFICRSFTRSFSFNCRPPPSAQMSSTVVDGALRLSSAMTATPLLTAAEITSIIHSGLPAASEAGVTCRSIHLCHGPNDAARTSTGLAPSVSTAVVRLPFSESQLRPGNTVSGPTLMMLADAAYYALALGVTNGNTMAVTSSFHMDFLRKPVAGNDLIALASLVKAGKRLIVMQTYIYSENPLTTLPTSRIASEMVVAMEHPNLVATGSGTYAVPSRSKM